MKTNGALLSLLSLPPFSYFQQIFSGMALTQTTQLTIPKPPQTTSLNHTINTLPHEAQIASLLQVDIDNIVTHHPS